MTADAIGAILGVLGPDTAGHTDPIDRNIRHR